MMELVFPTPTMKAAALAFRQEHFDNSEMEIHGDGQLDHAPTYEEWLEKLRADLSIVSGKFVPATTYFAVENGEIVGTIQIRHRLNESLLQGGGHIGYGIRPSRRGEGLGTKMLALALEKCRELGIERALLTCDKNNPASAKVMLKNGAVLENEITDENGRITQRYWIEV